MFSLERETVWNAAQAKAKFSEVMEQAQNMPQIITKHGKPSVVVVSVEEWHKRLLRKETFVDFMRCSPLLGAGLDLERLDDMPRDIDL